jgi:hypothetical protein
MGYSLCFFHGKRQGGFAKDVFARGQCCQHSLRVMARMIADIDTVNGGLGE